jgi:hypothetical protein
MGNQLKIEDLYSLEEYSSLRGDFRARVMEHKRHRKVALGDHIVLLFEDRLTMHYQIQEMLRVERIFEETGILEELSAYNPLIPDGANWKATMLIEYPDAEQRMEALARLTGIENDVWVKVGDRDPVSGVADEDLERSTTDKTSAVHFLRFELAPEMIASLKSGAILEFGVSHPEYVCANSDIPDATRESLIADLD